MTADVCGFCGGPGVTKEHLWSDWMRKVILDSRAAGGQKVFRAEIERGGESKFYTNPTLQQRIGMPCASCNNGWMSALETDVKDFLTPMVSCGENALLDPRRQRLLVLWAIKTAMIYEFTAAEDGKYFTAAERLAFKERFEIPQDVWVWTGRYDGVRPMHAYLRRAPRGADAPTLYSLTFSANFFALQVFSFRQSVGDVTEAAAATRTERLLQLYPASNWESWPPGITIDDDALAALDDRWVEALERLRR